MRIALMGAHCVGKTTLIEQILKQWPMYKRPSKTYREIIKEKQLSINKQGTKDSQKIILNALIDELQTASTSDDKFIIFDRCPIDNVVYTLWHHAKGTEGFTSDFVMDCKTIAAFSLKHIDVIFYVPARPEIPLTPREGREVDPIFREEIDNIFDSMVSSYEKNTGAFFPLEDCPAVIRLDGPPDMRLPQMKLYIKDSGIGYGEEDGSLIDTSAI